MEHIFSQRLDLNNNDYINNPELKSEKDKYNLFKFNKDGKGYEAITTGPNYKNFNWNFDKDLYKQIKNKYLVNNFLGETNLF